MECTIFLLYTLNLERVDDFDFEHHMFFYIGYTRDIEI